MADTKTFHGSLGPVVLEVESGGSSSASSSLSDVMSVLQDIAGAALEQLNRMEEGKRPSEFEVRFGLKGLSDGGVMVTQLEGSANFQIRMKWGGGGIEIPEL